MEIYTHMVSGLPLAFIWSVTHFLLFFLTNAELSNDISIFWNDAWKLFGSHLINNSFER